MTKTRLLSIFVNYCIMREGETVEITIFLQITHRGA